MVPFWEWRKDHRCNHSFNSREPQQSRNAKRLNTAGVNNHLPPHGTRRHDIKALPSASSLTYRPTTMAPSATADVSPSGRNSPKPPPAKIWSVSEPPFEGFKTIDKEGYARSNHET